MFLEVLTVIALVLAIIACLIVIYLFVYEIIYSLRHKPYNAKKTYSGKPRSGKSFLIARERALFEKLQSNSKEDEKR